MTGIIIDGFDVSSCKYYHYKGCSATGLRCENCTCYYKQLKRLQEKYDTLTNKFFNSETDKTQLEQENEELKELNLNLIQKTEDIIDINKAKQYQLRSNLKYKHALEEIKEIADIIANTNCNYVYEAEKILKIISEVENER